MLQQSTPVSGTTSASATARVYEDLRQIILTGQLAPGERLKVDRLKQMLGTGASPIREALSLLTSEQLVDRLDQRGFRVSPVSVGQFNEILSLRCSLEGMALTESIARADQPWEEALVLAHHRMARTPRTEAVAFEARHKAFHLALLARCASPILLRFCDQLYDLNIRYRHLAGRSGSYGARDVAQEHAAILSAAVERDAPRACAELTGHYRRTGEFLAAQLALL